MTNFKTITEIEMLHYICYGLLEKIEYEKARLAEFPEGQISPKRIANYTAQLEEINQRIVEIERPASEMRKG